MDKYAEIRKKALPLLKPYINRMAVFGSTVRGEATTKSDIDILITLKPSNARPKLGLFKLMEIEENLQKNWDVKWIWSLKIVSVLISARTWIKIRSSSMKRDDTFMKGN